MSDKVGRINQWSICLMLASLFFTIIASYPVHRPGSKPTLTYLARRRELGANRIGSYLRTELLGKKTASS